MAPRRVYPYVGDADLRERDRLSSERTHVTSGQDILEWVRQTRQALADGSVTATFIVDTSGALRIADRHSEHVACARGADVLAAGEITFAVAGGTISVSDVTNQSTGYCPEPESWPALDAALTGAGILHPPGYTTAFVFRRCEACGQRSIVKESCFECAVCGAPLSPEWNFHGD